MREGRAHHRAPWPLQEAQLRPAIAAQRAGFGDQFAAARAGRREEDRSRPAERLAGKGLELLVPIRHVVPHWSMSPESAQRFRGKDMLKTRNPNHSARCGQLHAITIATTGRDLQPIFDENLVVHHKKRAIAAATRGAAFLLDRAVEDLAE